VTAQTLASLDVPSGEEHVAAWLEVMEDDERHVVAAVVGMRLVAAAAEENWPYEAVAVAVAAAWPVVAPHYVPSAAGVLQMQNEIFL
jgi:hypothetical protein